jgi:hypothetical protein
MYLTAQRVVTPSGQRGVNVYEYLHGPVTWDQPLPWQYLPENNPGQLRRWFEETVTGGNAVISYLDIVVPDHVHVAQVQQWIAAIKQAIPASALARAYQLGPLWVRFGMSRMGIPPQTELGALAAHILLRLFLPPLPSGSYGPPEFG